MGKLINICLFVLILLVNKYVHSSKLNYPRVLLPIFQHKTINFTLETIEKTCFKWSSSRQDLISITPVYGISSECSNRAIVSVVTKEKRRNTAIVFAQDISTGETLRCDVIVDVIDKLNVRTTTRLLYLEEAPEAFELHAFDSQGNEFSTLEGIEFNWSITAPNQGSSKITPALRFLTFTDSVYHVVPASLESFEAQGLKGYLVLLEGINTGTSKVIVRMPHEEYSHVAPIEVQISVLANIIIEPSEAHILAGDTIDFRILQLKMGKLQEISLSSQYFFEVEDQSVATMKGNSVTALRLGRTMIILRDRNVDADNDNGVEKPKGLSAQLTVAMPVKLDISVLPYNNWLAVQHERHEIAFDLYANDGQKIILGNKYVISSELDATLFGILKKTRNGSRLYGETLREGVMQIHAKYKELEALAELQIFSPLYLKPAVVILPYDFNNFKSQKLQFNATGGDKNYVWHSSDPRLLQIDSNGVATTAVRETRGSKHDIDAPDAPVTTVKVALQRNQKIYRQSTVYFVPPERLEIKLYNFETALGDYVRLHVGIFALVNDTLLPFTKCENIDLELEFSNQIFYLEYNAEPVELAPDACRVLSLRSTSLGTTTLRVFYKFHGNLMQDVVSLNVFDPLKILSPEEQEIVLPIGSSRNIIFKNGPQRIFTLDAELSRTTHYTLGLIKVSELSFDTEQSLTAFSLLCRDFGTTKFRFNVHNVLSAKNYEIYNSEQSVTVRCVRPRFLKLRATQQLRTSCPREVQSSLLHVHEQDDKFEIEIEIEDAENRRLMNISSLWIDWEFSAGDKRLPSDSISYIQRSNVEYYHGVSLPGKDVLLVAFAEIAPSVRIKGTVSHYNEAILAKAEVHADRPPFGIKNPKTGLITKPLIENEIRFTAVDNKLLPFEHISIYLSDSHIERIPIAKGSGYYEYELSDHDVVEVKYDEAGHQLLVTPLRLGHVRLELVDLCLKTQSAFLSISVVGIGAISVKALDRVERTKTIEVIVKLLDTNDNPLRIDPTDLAKYQLAQNIYDPNILNIKLHDNQNNLAVGELRYLITGNNIGETKIVFNSGSGEQYIASEPLNVQVFSPIRLYPRNSTLIIGSSVQIDYQGGPQPSGNIQYDVQDKKIAVMESTIVTAQKLGKTTVTGKCVAKNPINGKEEIISEDTIELRVLALKNIEIRTPLVRIYSGAVMPATIWGEPGLSPMILGTLQKMRILWSTPDTDVIEIFNIFSQAGIEYNDNDMISVRVRGIHPGRATLNAVMQLADGQKLHASVGIIVVKKLELESPQSMIMDWLLVAPKSTLQLKCNMDETTYELDRSSSGSVVSVTSEGLLRSKDVLGRELIIAKTSDQTLPIGIEVKNIKYILATLQPSIKLKHLESKIPRGMRFILEMSLHDNLGNVFSHNIEDSNGLKYDLATKNFVDVQIGNNLTIAINLPRETNNMIAISLKDTTGVKHAEDYIKLSVAESQHIFPSNTIFSVGDIICFESPLTLPSIWTSSNDQILSINKQTGIAIVHGNQFKMTDKIVVANGYDTINPAGYIKFDVEVRDADVIQFEKTADIFNGFDHRSDLVLRNHMQIDKETNVVARNVSKCVREIDAAMKHIFKCQLRAKQITGNSLLQYYKVSPTLNTLTKQYACEIALQITFEEFFKKVSTLGVMDFDLDASLPNGLRDTIALKFVPGIKVSPTSLETSNFKEQELIITGLHNLLGHVKIKSSDPSYVKINFDEKSNGVAKYTVQYLRPLQENKKYTIEVSLEDTKQLINIPIVHSTAVMEKCARDPAYGGIFYIFFKIAENVGLIIATLLVAATSLVVYIRFFSFDSRRTCDYSAGTSLPQTPSDPTYHTMLHKKSPVMKLHHSVGSSRYENSFVYGEPSLHMPDRSMSPSRRSLY